MVDVKSYNKFLSAHDYTLEREYRIEQLVAENTIKTYQRDIKTLQSRIKSQMRLVDNARQKIKGLYK